MKISTNADFKKLSQALTCLAVVLALALSSCKKSGDSTSDPGTAYVSIINASPSSATYNAFLNTAQANTAALPFGGTTAYAPITGGTYTANFTSASSSTSLFTQSIYLSGGSVYSYFLIGRTAQLDGLLTADVMTTVSTDKAAVRFVNVSPDAPSMDLAVTGGANVVANQYYKGVSSFVAIAPNTYSFDIKDHTTGAVKTTLTGAALVAGKYYTILYRGLASPGDNESGVSAQLIPNQAN